MDRIYQAFLSRQLDEGLCLSEGSDLVTVIPVAPSQAGGDLAAMAVARASAGPIDRFVVRLQCTGLVRESDGRIVEANDFYVGIWFPSDYLRRANPFEVLTWLGPPNVWHANISDRAPFICVGRLSPGTPLVDLVFQCFEIVTYQKLTPREDDALNKPACQWARHNAHRIPVDRRPLKRRPLELRLETL